MFYTTKPELPIVLWQSQEVTGDNKMATISGLIPNSTYTICVLAFSGIGQGPLSVPVQVMTRHGGMYQCDNVTQYISYTLCGFGLVHFLDLFMSVGELSFKILGTI